MRYDDLMNLLQMVRKAQVIWEKKPTDANKRLKVVLEKELDLEVQKWYEDRYDPDEREVEIPSKCCCTGSAMG